MSEAGDAGERTEAATPKRIEDARRKGDVARSRELDTALTLTVGLTALVVFGPGVVEGLLADARRRFAMERAQLFDGRFTAAALLDALLEAVMALAPFFAVMLLAALSGPAFMGGFLISAKALKPDIKRMNPVKGLAKLVSARSAGELIKSLAKVVLCALAATLVARSGYERWLSLGRSALEPALLDAFVLVFAMVAALTGVTVLIAVADVPWQKLQYARKLRMTREEIKREQRESNGNPELKSKLRAEQTRISQQRMLDDVSSANVVITNPTHFAVALRYRDGEPAPTLVAKGVDEMALRIRALALEAGVRTVEAPALARALHHHTRIGATVRAELWQAVAQVLAFVVQLDRLAGERRRAGNGQRARAIHPPSASELGVPRHLSDPEPFAGADDLSD